MLSSTSRLLRGALVAQGLLFLLASCGPPPPPPTQVKPDRDADGFTANQGDCNDDDPSIYPGAEDFFGDGIDQDCSGADGVDLDRDGYPARAFGGNDCNDEDPKIHPDAKEIGWDEIDQNCDGVDLKDYNEIDAGEKFSCAITSRGNIQCWGDGELDQLRAPSTGRWVEIALGANFGCALDDEGFIECWGDDEFGQVSDAPTDGGWRNLAAGHNTACAIDGANFAHCWGFDYDPVKSKPEHGILTNLKTDLQVARISVGEVHACFIRQTDGGIECWGVPGPAGSDWTKWPVAQFNFDFLTVSTGMNSTCAVDKLRTIDCWGDNTFGQVNPADDTGPYYHHDSFERHSCAIKHAKDVVCWGDDKYNQVTGIPKEGTWKRVAVGKEHSCALSDIGEIFCWGRNDKGQTDAP